MNSTVVEIIGYMASGLVAVSLTMKRILYLRVINLMGGITFVIYALLIKAYPIVVVNTVISMINIYFLYQMFSAKEYFRLLNVVPESQYLAEFLHYYREDIQRFFPKFAYTPTSQTLVFFVLRDMVPTGVFIGSQEGDKFLIELDYVIEGYRDFKSGQYIYRDSTDDFAARGIKQLITTAEVPAHASYLERIGFQPQPANPTHYVMNL